MWMSKGGRGMDGRQKHTVTLPRINNTDVYSLDQANNVTMKINTNLNFKIFL